MLSQPPAFTSRRIGKPAKQIPAAAALRVSAFVVAKLDRSPVTSPSSLWIRASISRRRYATRLTLHILPAVAEHEAVMIADRTKAALAAAKVRGVKLGSPVAADTVATARVAKSAKARSKAHNLERSGVVTLSGIARALEARGIPTPSGNVNWQAAQVSRIRAMAT